MSKPACVSNPFGQRRRRRKEQWSQQRAKAAATTLDEFDPGKSATKSAEIHKHPSWTSHRSATSSPDWAPLNTRRATMYETESTALSLQSRETRQRRR